MWAVPHAFQCTHGLGCQGKSLLNIIVISQTEGNIGTKIFEVLTKGVISVLNVNGFGLVELVVKSCLTLPPLPCGVLTLAVIVGEYIIATGKVIVGLTSVGTVCDGEGEFGIEEAGREEKNTLRFRRCPCLTNMHFKAKSGKVLVDESQASSHVLPGGKNESAIINI